MNPNPIQGGPSVDPTSLILSPRTRRRQRGRGTVVLDNLTSATTITNPTVLTYDFIASVNPLMTAEVLNNLNHQGVPIQTGPSPDEMIIRSRGQRRVPLTFSPDVHLTTSPTIRQQRNKMSALAQRDSSSDPPGGKNATKRLLLPTRTSPRKRLTLTDSPPRNQKAPSNANAMNTPSPEKIKRTSLVTKKSTSNLSSPLVSSPESCTSSPKVLLKGLGQPQLVKLMEELMEKHPEIESEVGQMLPDPDLSLTEARLLDLKKNIFKALPSTRLESRTDSMAYNRVAIHLGALKKAVLEEAKALLDACQYQAVVDFSIMAWGYVKATPVWDNPPHNGTRKQCFKTLAFGCAQALKKCDLTKDLALEFKKKLIPLEKDSDDITVCLKHLDGILSEFNEK